MVLTKKYLRMMQKNNGKQIILMNSCQKNNNTYEMRLIPVENKTSSWHNQLSKASK